MKKNRFNGMTKQMNKVISKSDLTVSNKSKIIEINIDDIEKPPFHDRHSEDIGKIKELAEDISLHGIINPISVRYINGKYQRISGHRRVEAHKLLGKSKIKAIVFDNVKTDLDVIELMFSENHHRENPSEYDIVLFHLEGLSYMLNKKDDSLKQVISYSRKIEVGSIQTDDLKKLEEFDIIKTVLEKTKTFKTINSFYQKMNNILALNDILKDAIKNKEIYYSIAVELNKVNKSKKTQVEIERFLKECIISNSSLSEIKTKVKKFLVENTDILETKKIKKIKNKLRQIISKVDELTNDELKLLEDFFDSLNIGK